MINETSSLLDQRLASMSPLPPVAWQNVVYTPEIGTLYIRANNLRGPSETYSLGYSEEHIGIYQIDVVAPKDNGRKQIEEQSDAIRDHFRADRDVSGIEIKNVITSPLRYEGENAVISVSVNYRVHTND